MIPHKPIVTLLLILQVVSIAYLWTSNPVGGSASGLFAVFLAVDLLSFSLVCYLYTHVKWGEAIRRVWLLVGALGLVILLLAGLFLPSRISAPESRIDSSIALHPGRAVPSSKCYVRIFQWMRFIA